MALALRDSAVWTVDPQRHVAFDLALSHSNGLRLERPAGYIEAEMSDGFVLAHLSDDEVPMEIRVQVLDEKPGAYRALERPLSWLSGRATYVVRRRRTPELGDYYELKAFRRERDAWLLITATAKGDWREPDFGDAWAVLDQAQMVLADPEPDATIPPPWPRLWTPEICMPQRTWRHQDKTLHGHETIKPTYIDPRC